MIVRLVIAVTLWCSVAAGTPAQREAGPSPSPSAASPAKASRLAPFKERLLAAETVKVQTNILGLELEVPLQKAREKLDPLRDPEKPVLEEGNEPEKDDEQHRVLWNLAKSDFKNVYVKTDKEERLVYIAGFIREGKEIPFQKIGQVEKAPLFTDSAVAWDVVRPDKPLIRVVARGEKKMASSITIFVVKPRPREKPGH